MDSVVSEETNTVVVEATKDEKAEKPTNVKVSSYRQQKVAMSGMGFLLQQMRSTSSSTTIVKETIEEIEKPKPVERKIPVRPEAVDYKPLSLEQQGAIQIEPFQIIQDCFNENTTPKFNFAPNCKENNYVRSCKFSPTGKHLITDSEDRRFRIFDFSDEDRLSLKKSVLNGDLIYDLIWDPFGEQFATTSGGSPIKLWDCDGEQTASYHGINHMDELDPSYCMAFNANGDKIYAGYKGVIRRFEVNRPGAQISQLKTYVKGQAGQRTVLSCIAMSPLMDGVFAVGSFNGCVGFYSDFTNSCDMLVPTQNSYVTCIQYSSDGKQFFVGGKNSSVIECYDVRNTATLLSQYVRPVSTGQRVNFKLDPEDRYLFSGSTCGDIRVFDLKSSQSSDLPIEPTWIVKNASKCVTSSIDLHPTKPILASAHGQRVFPLDLNDEDDVEMEVSDDYLLSQDSFDNSLKLWRF